MTANEVVSGEDLDVILELLDNDFFEEEIQPELDEIADEVRPASVFFYFRPQQKPTLFSSDQTIYLYSRLISPFIILPM